MVGVKVCGVIAEFNPFHSGHAYLLQKARELVGISEIPMGEIAGMLGFEDALYFSKKFRAYYGMSPSQYRKNAVG